MVTRGAQVVVFAAAFGVAACDSPPRVKPWRHAPDPTAEAARAPQSPALTDDAESAGVRANRDHTLRVHVDAEPGRLNPLLSPSRWARRIGLGTMFETLIEYAPPAVANQVAGAYTPGLATSWRVMPGGTEIRLYLQQGVTFHDGRPMTSVDVQFTLDAIRDPRRGVDHLRRMLVDVFAVELITTYEVRLVLLRPSGYVLRALAEIPILPMHVYDGSLAAGGALVGTGPYRYVSNKGGVVHLTRHDKYWGTKPAIKDVEYVYQPDAAIALKDAKRGDLDVIPSLVPAHWPEQASAPGIAAAFRALELGSSRLRYLAFNATKPPLDDPRVRHAIGLLIDRRNISKRVFDGLARPATWPIWPGGFVNGAEATVPEFDPAGAAKLLDAAGWLDSDKDGIRDKDGVQLRLAMLGSEKPAPKDASAPPVKIPRDYFIEAARKMGVVIDVKAGGESWVEKKFDEGAFDLAEVSWTSVVDWDLTQLLGSKQPHHAPAPAVDRILDAMAAAWDPAQRTKLGADLAAALNESWVIAGIVADAPQGLVHKRVRGIRVWDGWFDVASLSFEAP